VRRSWSGQAAESSGPPGPPNTGQACRPSARSRAAIPATLPVTAPARADGTPAQRAVHPSGPAMRCPSTNQRTPAVRAVPDGSGTGPSDTRRKAR